MDNLKEKKWYQSELYWLLISVGITFILIVLGFIIPLQPYLFIPSFAYIGYFTIKGIIYAWIINPYNAWKKKKGK